MHLSVKGPRTTISRKHLVNYRKMKIFSIEIVGSRARDLYKMTNTKNLKYEMFGDVIEHRCVLRCCLLKIHLALSEM